MAITVGIEKLSLYPGRLYADALDLAEARGSDRTRMRDQVMVACRTVVPVFEDTVTLAVNAAQRLLTPEDRASIGLVIVATESGVDFGKSISTWVHRFCELPANCCGFELKNACYGGTGALKMASAWIASGAARGRKALVISADYTRSGTRDEYDAIGGGSAVAMLVSDTPRLLALELEQTGHWANELTDAFRPTSRVETVDSEISLYSYLDALEGAFEHYEQLAGPVDFAAFKKHIYHAPFPGMPLIAHRTLLQRSGVDAKDVAAITHSYRQKVQDGIHFGRRVGTAYGASNFISLLGHLTVGKDLTPGDRIAFFAYGSGCQGEFYSGVLGEAAEEQVGSLELDRALDERRRVSVKEYELIEATRDSFIDCPDYVAPRELIPGVYEDLYRGQHLLLLERVEDHRRVYGWS